MYASRGPLCHKGCYASLSLSQAPQLIKASPRLPSPSLSQTALPARYVSAPECFGVCIVLAAQSGARNLVAPHAMPVPPPLQPALPCLVADLIHCLSPGGGAPLCLVCCLCYEDGDGGHETKHEREGGDGWSLLRMRLGDV